MGSNTIAASEALCKLLASACMAIVATTAHCATEQPRHTMVVLDASNSMWGRIAGETKFDIARKAVLDFGSAFPPDQHMGLTVYGHRQKDRCSDIETVLEVGAPDKKKLSATLGSLTPRGKTPLAQSIQHAAEALDYRKRAATIILVSDGLETCHADPCAATEQLAKDAKDLTVHVIGFDMRPAERAQLKCIAAAGHGKFMLAATAPELALALAAVDAAPAKKREAPRESAQLTAMPKKPKAGDKIEVSWNGTAKLGDTVSISLPEVPVGGGASYPYVKNTGKAIVTAPDVPGVYELRYLEQQSRQVLGSLELEVAPAGAQVTVPPTVSGNQIFEAQWTGPANRGDQILLLDPSEAKSVTIAYANARPGGSPAKLRAPSRSGEFSVVYRTENGVVLAQERLTVSMTPIVLNVKNPVKSGKPFIVQWTGNAGAGDTITYTPVVDDAAAGRTYFNASGGHAARLVAPSKPGRYEIQFKSGTNYSVLASETLVVE